MLPQLPWKTTKLFSQLQHFLQMLILRIKALLGDTIPFEPVIRKLPNRTRQPGDSINRKSHCFAYISKSSAMVLLSNRSYNSPPVPAIFLIDVLYYFLA